MSTDYLEDLTARYLQLLRSASPEGYVAARVSGRVLPSDLASLSLPQETMRALRSIHGEFVERYCTAMAAKVPMAPRGELERRATQFFLVAVSNLPDGDRSPADDPRSSGSGGGYEDRRREIEEHLVNHLGPAQVLHKLGSGDQDIDVYIFRPTEERPYVTGVTIGISHHPMVVPHDEPDRRHQELMIYLPASWQLEPSPDPLVLWPFGLLKALGRFAQAEETYFAPGHTVALANPPEPFAPGSLLTTALLLGPPEAPTFDNLNVGGTRCCFLSVLPLTSAEADYKLCFGSTALLQRLQEAGVQRQVDPARPCAITGVRPLRGGP